MQEWTVVGSTQRHLLILDFFDAWSAILWRMGEEFTLHLSYGIAILLEYTPGHCT